MNFENIEILISENIAILISAAAGLIGLISLALAWTACRKYKTQQGLLEFVGKQNSDLEESVAKTNELLETSRQKTADQARRVAWLEMRVRQPQLAKDEVIVDEAETSKSLKSNITERRHRVLSLSSRGQSYEKIASTLGMMPGEVELIVKFNRANLAVN